MPGSYSSKDVHRRWIHEGLADCFRRGSYKWYWQAGSMPVLSSRRARRNLSLIHISINGGIVATNEMNRPIGTIADGYITNHCLLYIDKRQHMRTGIEVRHRLQLVRIFQFLAHKGDTVSVYSSCSGDGYLFQVLTINPHHTFTTVIAESAQCIGSLLSLIHI